MIENWSCPLNDSIREKEASEQDVFFKPIIISSVFICMLCNGFFRNATTLKECSHTFCRICIIKYIANNNSNCPACKTAFSGNNNEQFIKDQKMQQAVDKLFPYFVQNEEFLKHRYNVCRGLEPPNEQYKNYYEYLKIDKIMIQEISSEFSHNLLNELREENSTVLLQLVASDYQEIVVNNIFLENPYLCVSGCLLVNTIGHFILNRLNLVNYNISLYINNKRLLFNETIEHACRNLGLYCGPNAKTVPMIFSVAKIDIEE